MNFLKQPLTQFLMAGAGIFLLYGLVNPSADRPDADEIIVDQATMSALNSQFQGVWGRSPSVDEQRQLIDEFLREEIYYREAVAMGLDQNDTVVRRRMQQKLAFLLQSQPADIEPPEEDLEAYYTSHAEQYQIPGGLAFTQVFLGDKPDQAAILSTYKQLTGGADPASLSTASLLPVNISLSSDRQIDKQFGTGFFTELLKLAPGEWQGPVRSGFGLHWVKVRQVEAAIQPEFQAVKPKVLSDWRDWNAKELESKAFKALRDKYTVTITGTAP